MSSAIEGQFTKMETVATRKVVRLHIECPIEKADEILRVLGGFPDPSNAQWIGMAPLNVERESVLKGGKISQAAGIMCAERAFQQFCDASDAEEAAAWLRQRCGIKSRAHLDHNDEAAKQFREAQAEYQAWLKVVV